MPRSGNPNLSLEETAEASKRAAKSALELAVRARAVAVDKAEVAARAMAAAKRALDLAASISEDEENKERYLKKNRMTKHLPVQTLYNKEQAIDKSDTDEEFARNLHQAMNSSHKISKGSPRLKGSKNKRQKFNGNGFMNEGHGVRVDESTPKCDEWKVIENGEKEGTSHFEENKFELLDGMDSTYTVRGRMKKKTLPLNPEEEMKSGSSPCSAESEEKTVSDNSPTSSMGPLTKGVEKTSTWKCKAFKTDASVKENELAKS